MKKQLINSDQRFRRLSAGNYSGMTFFDADYHIKYRSPTSEKLTGWPTSGRQNVPVGDMVHPEDRAGVVAMLQEIRATAGLSLTATFRSRHYAGHDIWLQATYTNMLEEPGIEAIICSFIDVSAQKDLEMLLKKQTAQISELLETMNDGFVALDENLCYTFVNPRVLQMTGKTEAELLGKNIWEVFPDAVGSVTWQAVETAYRQQIYCCNEDFYPPLQLWQENRAYPSAGGVSLFIRDITRQKKEEHHLKLLESVIINTTDAVLITEAQPFDEAGQRILYVNEAFTRMTNYSAEEVLGKTPRILQGPKTDRRELDRLGRCLRKWQSCEATVINYKKNREAFWINFTLNPVADANGWFTHWISIERDVTRQKQEELNQALLAEVGLIFSRAQALRTLLDELLVKLVSTGQFELGEIWLTGADKQRISLSAHHAATERAGYFYQESGPLESFRKGQGLPGTAWASREVQLWEGLAERADFIRRDAAGKAGIRSAYGVPLFAENQPVGVLILGMADVPPDEVVTGMFKELSSYLGTALKRKQLEEELERIFTIVPDMICIAGSDRYFKKVNPAMCRLLGYTETELLTTTITKLLHPDDRAKSAAAFESLATADTIYYENRFLTRSGKPKWLAWTATRSAETSLLFCVGKDITEKKELELLLDKITDLALIGGWEVSLPDGGVYWSKITRQLHEVDAGYEPSLASGLAFYRGGESRDTISRLIGAAMQDGTSFNTEVELITARGNSRWVRVIGEAELADGHCTRVYGSFQDVDERVRAQQKARAALEERNVILESVGDAFYAVDRNWTLTYWNQKAAEVLRHSKAEMLGRHLWEIFPDATDNDFYRQYHLAMDSGQAVHFEDYYAPYKTWYEISAYPSENGLSVYFRDITRRKLTELRLTESEQRYSDLFQLSPLPKFVFDVETLYFMDVNDAAINHYGYTRAEFLAMTVMDLRRPEDIPQMNEILAAYESDEPYVAYNAVNHRKKNGKLIQTDIRSNAVSYQGRRARLVVARDITESLNHLRAIEEQNAKLREIAWMQSHIIRAPLSRIMGLVPLIAAVPNLPADTREMLNYLSLSAAELDQVIRLITEKTSEANAG